MSDLVTRLRQEADVLAMSKNKSLKTSSTLMSQAASRLLDLGEQLAEERSRVDAQAKLIESLLEQTIKPKKWPEMEVK